MKDDDDGHNDASQITQLNIQEKIFNCIREMISILRKNLIKRKEVKKKCNKAIHDITRNFENENDEYRLQGREKRLEKRKLTFFIIAVTMLTL